VTAPGGVLFDDIPFGTYQFVLDGQGGSGVQYHLLFAPSGTTVVPYPAALPLLLSGLVALGLVARRRKKTT
jgi:hypothetical protein